MDQLTSGLVQYFYWLSQDGKVLLIDGVSKQRLLYRYYYGDYWSARTRIKPEWYYGLRNLVYLSADLDSPHSGRN